MHPSASFSASIRIRIANEPGAFARLAATIGEAGGLLGAIDLVRVEGTTKIRDVNVLADDEQHLDAIVDAVRSVEGVEVVHVSDRVFLAHLGGKLEIKPRMPLKTREDLSMVYTPGVARVSSAIADDPEKVWNLTIKRNTVAVVSDGTAVLGLGDIGPEAALPVMEGKAVLFKEFADVDAFPICLATKDPDEIVRTVEAIAPVFGGINLEDISAPRCFEIERGCASRSTSPSSTTTSTARRSSSSPRCSTRCASSTSGSRTSASSRPAAAPPGWPSRARSSTPASAGSSAATRAARSTAAAEGSTRRSASTPRRRIPTTSSGTADELLDGADVFIGVSVPGAISVEGVRRMAPRAIVFAMANPNPEVDPEAIEGLAEVIATGRSDYPNQINNVLAFPGVFRGALDVRASEINAEMEARRRPRDRRSDRRRRALGGLRDPERLQPRRRSGRRRRGGRCGAADRRRAQVSVDTSDASVVPADAAVQAPRTAFGHGRCASPHGRGPSRLRRGHRR